MNNWAAWNQPWFKPCHKFNPRPKFFKFGLRLFFLDWDHLFYLLFYHHKMSLLKLHFYFYEVCLKIKNFMKLFILIYRFKKKNQIDICWRQNSLFGLCPHPSFWCHVRYCKKNLGHLGSAVSMFIAWIQTKPRQQIIIFHV